MMTNDPKDRHVAACAVIGGAELIVTDNIKDFSDEDLRPLGISAVTTDSFLADQVELAPDVVVNELREEIWRERHLHVLGVTWDDYLATLTSFPLFHQELVSHLRFHAPHLAPVAADDHLP